MKDILATIIQYRQQCGWTEYQLAERSGLPQSTISSWYRKIWFLRSLAWKKSVQFLALPFLSSLLKGMLRFL